MARKIASETDAQPEMTKSSAEAQAITLLTGKSRREFDEVLAKAQVPDDLMPACRALRRFLGIDYFLMFVRIPERDQLPPVQIAISGMPAEWIRLYDERGYGRTDPILRKSAERVVAFGWDELDFQTRTEDRDYRRESAACGLKDGFSVPLHGPGQQSGHLSFARADKALPAAGAERLAIFHAAQVHALQLYSRLLELVATESLHTAIRAEPLSRREREVLALSAKGFTAAEVASNLGITARTVAYFLQISCSKLGCATTREAIFRATLAGQLNIAEYPAELSKSTTWVVVEPTQGPRPV
jgi:DNA-binding CsgD family transcriptional regulator